MKAALYIILLYTLLMGCDKYSEKIIEPNNCNLINYYYYGDSIITLGELSNEYITVAFDSSATESQIRNFIAVEKIFDTTYHYTPYSYFVPLKFKEPKSCQEITALITTLQKNPIVVFVHYTMKTDCSYTFMPILGSKCIMIYSNYFRVKVKNVNDLTDLNAMIKSTRTELVYQNSFMPQWFTLRANKNSKGDALRMANHFKESKLFEYAEPNPWKIPVE